MFALTPGPAQTVYKFAIRNFRSSSPLNSLPVYSVRMDLFNSLLVTRFSRTITHLPRFHKRQTFKLAN
jgi:hypothetical protein